MANDQITARLEEFVRIGERQALRTASEIATLFGAPNLFAARSFTLRPEAPVDGNASLGLQGALWVETSPTSEFGTFALLRSTSTFGAGVEVTVEPVVLGKFLVEFELTFATNPDPPVQLRFTGPTDFSQDVTVTASRIIEFVFDAIPDSRNFTQVSLRQLGPPSEGASWVFRSVRLTGIPG